MQPPRCRMEPAHSGGPASFSRRGLPRAAFFSGDFMSDDSNEPQIPQAALDRWGAIADDVPLQLALTRGDMDNLMLALRNLAIGQSQLVAALSAHTNQDLEGCVEAMTRANELCLSSFERINALISAIMQTAAPRSAVGEGAAP